MEVIACPLLRQRPVECGDIEAAIAVEILDDPVVAAVAIRMEADLAGRIVETLATREASQAGGMEGVPEIRRANFLEGSRSEALSLESSTSSLAYGASS
jgi:hypothetical protein